MLKFILNNTLIQTSTHEGITLLDFIRQHQYLMGTKIGCREGDCGACTVLVGTLQTNNTVKYQNITSCISPLGNAQGKHIVTIEGLNLAKKLNTAQAAMANNYATQCGFCTPGFVVSLCGFALAQNAASNEAAIDAIGGNICRCTGYKSIEKAAYETCAKLENKPSSNRIAWLVAQGFIPPYFTSISERLLALQNDILTNNLQVVTKQQGTFVGGGTDLYVRHADKLSDEAVQLLNTLTYQLPKNIALHNNIATFGAAATVTDMFYHEGLSNFFPQLKTFLKLVSSEPIRNMGTLAGNFVNASPIGDMTIFFLALNSRIYLKNKQGKTRSLYLKDFYQGYKTYNLNEKEGEFIEYISFHLPSDNTHFNFEKVCKRTYLDIASVNTALSVRVNDGYIEQAHIAIGGVAPIPKYLHQTSTFLTGKPLNRASIKQAINILQNEIAPISDVRGSSEYKRLLAQQLFTAHFTELFPATFQLPHFLGKSYQ